MKSHHCLVAVVALAAVGTTLAADLPKRKSGLWEVKTSMPDMPSQGPQGPIQVCVDEKTDDLAQAAADAEAKKNCSKSEIKHEGDRYVIHSVCKDSGVTMTTDGVFTGKFDSAYRAEMKATYDPPIMNMKESRMVMDARWLGPCKPGMQPGELLLPNGQKIDPRKMTGK